MFDFSKKLVLFDRDGVLNENHRYYVTKPDELRPLSNALRGIARLTQAGFRIGVCTNQSGLARGVLDEATLHTIHHKLLTAVASFGGRIDHLLFCPSGDDAHPDRKPNPGMLHQQAAFFQTDLTGVPFVGDNWVDVVAARRAGASPVLVRTGKGREVLRKYRGQLADVAIYSDVECAVNSWLQN